MTSNGEDIKFTYQAPLVTVQEVSVSFSDTDFKHKAVVSGVNLDSTTQLYIDGHA